LRSGLGSGLEDLSSQLPPSSDSENLIKKSKDRDRNLLRLKWRRGEEEETRTHSRRKEKSARSALVRIRGQREG
jgi:hypothetical protein